MMSSLIISDLHLSTARPAITHSFIQLVESFYGKIHHLYILGDLFNYWVGDDYSDTEVVRVKQLLRQAKKHQIHSYFIHGNRDFLLGTGFAAETGIQILPDESPIMFAQQPAIITHGDQLCTRDSAHQQFRTMTQSIAWRKAILAKPLPERVQLAEQFRTASKANHSRQAEDIMDVTPEAVTALMEKHQVQLLIHGHTHRPAVHQLKVNHKPGQRIVLGDWEQKGWYLTDMYHTATLQSFNINAS